MAIAVIEYLCANSDHWPAQDAVDPLVRHLDGVGYCPLGADDGHDWRATGGRTLATVREWMNRPASSS